MKQTKGFFGCETNKKPGVERSGTKGFIYTLFTMAFLLSLSIFVLVQDTGYKGGLVAEKIRSDELGFFVEGVQQDIGRGILISGRKAALAFINNETDSGEFIPAGMNANESIMELLQNGTFQGAPLDIMKNSTVSEWTGRLQQIGRQRGINVNISTGTLSVLPKSAFELVVAGNVTVVAYDPLTKTKYNRTFFLQQPVSVEELEDPYITIKSFGARKNSIRACDAVSGIPPGSQRTYGRAYASKNPDCSGVSSHGTRIFVTNTMDGKLQNCYDFGGNVTEDETASGTIYLKNATGAYSATKDGTYVVLSGNKLWITNITIEPGSCYFEAPGGPSFLDRLEGRGSISAKYTVPNAVTGIGSFVKIPPSDYRLDYEYYG